MSEMFKTQDGEILHVTRRHPRRTPMSRRLSHAFEGAGGDGSLAEQFPGIAIPEPEHSRKAWISYLIAFGVHAGMLLALLIASWIAAPEIIEKVIPVQLIQEPPAEKSDPAPARKALAERRMKNFAPKAQAVKPQVVNPRVVARSAPQVEAKAVEMNAVSRVAAPQDVSRQAIAVEKVRAVSSTAATTQTVVSVDTSASPALRGPVVAQAPVGASAGPRQIVSEGDTIGTGTARLGDGSSVSEGIVTGRDVLGSPDGAPLADVRTAVGEGYMSGSGGTGSGGISADDCLGRPEVRAYYDQVKQRIYARWALPPGVPANMSVKIRFSLDPAGSARDIKLLDAGDPRLGSSAVDALRSASPFPPMPNDVRCMAGLPIVGTFRNPLATGVGN